VIIGDPSLMPRTPGGYDATITSEGYILWHCTLLVRHFHSQGAVSLIVHERWDLSSIRFDNLSFPPEPCSTTKLQILVDCYE
jgi:hypothetical protein